MMAWIINEKELASVLQLETPKRYSYCVKKIADLQRLYSLKNDAGWAVAADDAGNELIPIWPHEAFASLCAVGPWHGYFPQAIAIDVWLARWIPGIERDGRLIAVFPTAQNYGVAVNPADFAAHLQAELAKYE
jgi:Protein of unknown function (DUF2750)